MRKEDELYSMLACALMHDINVCDTCNLCEGEDAAERRTILVEKLAEYMNKPLPWREK